MSGQSVVVSRSGGASRERRASFAGSHRATAFVRGPREARYPLGPHPALAAGNGGGSSDNAANLVDCNPRRHSYHFHCPIVPR